MHPLNTFSTSVLLGTSATTVPPHAHHCTLPHTSNTTCIPLHTSAASHLQTSATTALPQHISTTTAPPYIHTHTPLPPHHPLTISATSAPLHTIATYIPKHHHCPPSHAWKRIYTGMIVVELKAIYAANMKAWYKEIHALKQHS